MEKLIWRIMAHWQSWKANFLSVDYWVRKVELGMKMRGRKLRSPCEGKELLDERQSVFTATIVAWPFWGNQLLSDWTWSLLHSKEFMPGAITLVSTTCLWRSKAKRSKTVVGNLLLFLLNGHVVKLPSTYLFSSIYIIAILNPTQRNFFRRAQKLMHKTKSINIQAQIEEPLS